VGSLRPWFIATLGAAVQVAMMPAGRQKGILLRTGNMLGGTTNDENRIA
jgi:hypothetical protein